MNPKEESTAHAKPKRRSISRKTLKKIAWGAAAFLTVTILYYQIERWRGARAWEAAKKDYLAAGGSLEMQEHFPPAPPAAAENFGALPLFKEISLLNSSLGQQNRKRLEEASLRPPEGYAEGKAKPSSSLELDEYLLKYAAFLNLETQSRSSSEIAQELLNLTEQKAGDIIREMKEGIAYPISQLPQSPFETTKEDYWFECALPHLTVLLDVSQTLRLRGQASIELGDRQVALESVLLLFQLKELVKKDFLVGILVAQGFDHMAMGIIERGIQKQVWSDDDLKSIVQTPNFSSLSKTLLSTFEIEAIVLLQCIDVMKGSIRERIAIEPLIEALDQSGEARGSFRFKNVATPRGWYDLRKAELVRLLLPFLSLKNSPNNLSELLTVIQRSEKKLEAMEGSPSPSTKIISEVSPAISKTGNRIIAGDLRRELARVSCAIERYRLANNDIPSSLSELVPDYLNAPPLDPIDRAPLRYQPQGANGYTLYSIGVDRQDNNGKPDKNPGSPTKGTDVVWTIH